MRQIPEAVINEVIDRCGIYEVISGYIPLKQSGRNFKALCPFHHEKTPSFMVNPDKQIFHCFGCGVGGDVISFIMKYDRMDFPEAVEILARRAGVDIPRPEKNISSSLTAQLYRINELAADFYRHILKNSSPAEKARRYLKERHLNPDTLDAFRIGYAPEGWEGFIKFAAGKGFKLDILEKAGLVVLGKEGNMYDRFRDRVIFPIFDVQNKIVGFGARVLDDSLPKYINSPDTLIYHKSKLLYGLNQAKDYIRREDYAVIVEGYVDLITPYQNGIRNLVASLGTALTYEQVRLLKRYTHNAVIIYDADEAGELATLRGLDILVEEGMDVKVASLPKGYDPDLFVRRRGPAEFLEFIKNAKNIFEYKLEVLSAKYNIRMLEDKAKIAQEMLLTTKKINNAVLQSGYIRKLSGVLSVSEEALLQEMRKIKQDMSPLQLQRFTAISEGKAEEVNAAEKILIILILENKTARAEILQRVKPEEFSNPETQEIIQTIVTLTGRNMELTAAKVFNAINSETAKRIFSKILAAECGIADIRKNIDDCIRHLRRRNIERRCAVLKGEIQQAENTGNHQRISVLLKEYNGLLKERS